MGDIDSALSTPLDFWHANLGRFLSEASAHASSKAPVPTRMKKGVGLNPLGAGAEAAYIVTPQHAWLIGRFERENTDRVTFVATDTEGAISSRKFIARWLVENATAPFMVGIIGNANPNASFRISTNPAMGFFCEASGGFGFNLNDILAARGLIGDLPWKTVATAIHQYHAHQRAQSGQDKSAVTRERAKLVKILDKEPRLRNVLQNANVRPNSGEYRVLSWLLYEA